MNRLLIVACLASAGAAGCAHQHLTAEQVLAAAKPIVDEVLEGTAAVIADQEARCAALDELEAADACLEAVQRWSDAAQAAGRLVTAKQRALETALKGQFDAETVRGIRIELQNAVAALQDLVHTAK